MRFSTLIPLCLSFASAAIAQAVTYEAENGVRVGTTVLSELAGFSGTGYVGGFDESSDSVTFTVHSTGQKLYELSVRYAGIYGSKYTRMVLNNASGGDISLPESTGWETASGGKVLLKDGANTIKLENNWGWYLIDSITLAPAAARPPHKVTDALVNPATNTYTKNLMKFLVSHYGSKYISGQQDPASYRWVEQNVGKSPAMIGLDLIEYSPSRVEFGSTSTAVEDAIAFDRRGGIVNFCWHWNSPSGLINTEGHEWWRGFYTEHTKFDISKALADTTNADYKLLIRDIDAIAVQLKRLSDANVPVLWRPLHEAEGGWFWWGAKGPEPCKKLWRILYDRLTNHHKLNNLIWVWNSVKTDWYPGDDVVDIVSYDSYPAAVGDHGPVSAQYDALVALTGDRKLIAMTECSAIPDPDLNQLYGTHWSWFVVWNGEFIQDGRHNSLDYLKKIYAMEYVLTLDEIQGWKDAGNFPSATISAIQPSSVAPTSTRAPTSTPVTSSAPTSVPVTTTSSLPAPQPTCSSGKWQQCGGIGFSGCKTCVAGATCTKLNDYYHQCL